MHEDFHEARVYIRKRATPGEAGAMSDAESASFESTEVRLTSVRFDLRPFGVGTSATSLQENIAWITGRVSVFFGHAPDVAIDSAGNAQLSIDAGPFPLKSELEAFAIAITFEASHIGMDCTCSAVARDGSRLRMVEGELVAAEF